MYRLRPANYALPVLSWLFHRHLEKDETLQHVVHRHWLLALQKLWLPTSALFLAGALALAFPPTRATVVAAAVVLLPLTFWWIGRFLDTYLDAWLITDQAVIAVTWHGWFHRQSSRILYSDINGVSHEIQGILATLFRFGTITIEKISTGGIIALDAVKHPRRVESAILQCQEAYLRTKNLKDSTNVRDILAEMVSNEVQLRR